MASVIAWKLKFRLRREVINLLCVLVIITMQFQIRSDASIIKKEQDIKYPALLKLVICSTLFFILEEPRHADQANVLIFGQRAL